MTSWGPGVKPSEWSNEQLLRVPATWISVALLLSGAGWAIRTLGPAAVSYPTATLVATILFTAYAVPFCVIIARIDYHEPEPKLLLAGSFGWGGLVALAASARGNEALEGLLARATSPETVARWGAALIAPTIEEPLKLLGLVMLVLVARSQLNSPVDGVVYGAVLGLGFQLVENIIYALKAVVVYSDGDQIGPVITIFLFRGFMCGLWSHAVFTTLSGLGLAYLVLAVDKSRWRRAAALVLGLTGAWLCHFAWNAPWLTDGLSTLGEAVVKGAPSLLLVITLTQMVWQDEHGYYHQKLRDLNDPEIATSAEIEALSTHGGRVRARASELAEIGWREDRLDLGRKALMLRDAVGLIRAMQRLHRAQVWCAVQLSRDGNAGNGDPPSTPQASLAAARAKAQVTLARRQVGAIKNRYRDPR